ncbi:3'(2'),5'-bisphosphate nucleotidase CysQ [Microbulbifer thermotolerans]|uniref:3'(2'),5'-bisphosphate nucleotidase CysQ n=1 Tax=Microbulbifer thermotolerans TaxID=252514 RepID=A0A143HR46_MICTH|nr:3'(2'),5'-bisphosphate nucleotidase CysQ [Microbulbifer thermotolerans]AMX03752.1 3'(2'),5'-bisphosphate nucleotidase CysQ [Microbulbifer thermotolerans]MCX2783582.1 3'(2'),5'-bisphosphate nucleotidase CysQ [Microbulbifer thermotolerans]MCX2795793.1 3'(2'),5'-bisphosphate nucleotidase CysQ [Microbulbifer thermotolerans]MCX2833774.1 3'(2'),5'-bisphosphate nucleotidase CysQ [Microbulbifer thermotolerans]MCX2842039.1 3'(2'),5'-bisphosphate nucleotidase CysQ [Microbulbifer thermotolerans]
MENTLLERVIEICARAGEAILEVYNSSAELAVETKADDSPVTAADLAAHAVLAPALADLIDGVPVLSEEQEMPSFAERSRWQRYWIVDPLDGTKEFIRRNGEFTVNVALIENGEPVLGVVYVPVLGITYAGARGNAAGGQTIAFKRTAEGEKAIRVRALKPRLEAGEPVELVASRSHGAGKVEQLVERIESHLGPVACKSMGSSLKLCLVAEGAADLYPRLAPTCEWDTAAAQAVVEAAGGRVVSEDFRLLRYNTKDSLLNPFFYVIGDPAFGWRELLTDHA